MTDPTKPNLTILAGPESGRSYELDPVDNLLIGSDSSCPFCIDSPGISPIHARIWVDAEGVTVFDTHSPTGVYVNDDRVVEKAPLRNGDILWLGTPGDETSVMIQVSLPLPPEAVEASAQAAESAAVGAEFVEEAEVVEAEPPPLASPDAAPVELPVEESFAMMEAEPPPLPQEASVEAPPIPAAEAGDAFVVDEEPPATIAIESTPASSSFFVEDEVPPPVPPPVEAPPPEPAAEPAFFTEEPPSAPIEEEFVVDEPPVAAAPAPPPPPPTPPPPPAPPRVAAPEPAAKVEPKPAPKKAPETPAARKPAAPAAARPAPAPRPAAAPAPRPAPKAGGPPVALYGAIGAAVLVLGGGVAWYFTRSAPAPPPPQTLPPPTAAAATTLPPPETVPPETTPAETQPPPTEVAKLETPPPVTQPPVVEKATPPPPVTKPTPAPKPTPTPKAAATPAAAAAPTEAQLAQQRAAQVANLISQAEAAASAHKYDQAASLYDDVLKLDAQNAKAGPGKAAAVAAAASMKKAFVVGKTTFIGKAKKGPAGFDDNEPADPEYQGRIEFEISPPNLKPGDNYSAKVFLVNEGKKPIKINTLALATVFNGQRAPGPSSPQAKEAAPGQRVALAEVGGSWRDGTKSFAFDVLVTSARGETYHGRAEWR